MIFSIVTWLILSCSALELVYLLYLAWSSIRVPQACSWRCDPFLIPGRFVSAGVVGRSRCGF